MKPNNSEIFATEMKELAERLEICQQVKRYDSAEEKQAWTLAHNLLDLEQSFRTYLDQQFPRLKKEELNPDQMNDLLLEIGEEFRHILYHIRDSAFYAYLRE